jgi:hypothetical protein
VINSPYLIVVGMMMLPVAGSVSAQTAGSCFNIEAAPWEPIEGAGASNVLYRPPPDEGADSLYFTIPTRIVLTNQEAMGWLLVNIPETALQTPHRYRLWRVEGDRLHLTFSTGYVGALGSFAKVADEWVGKFETELDVFPVLRYERDAVLREVGCGSLPPLLATRDRQLPRSFELSTGHTLELGKSLPPGVPVTPRLAGGVTVLAEVRGAFSGANPIIAISDDAGTVVRVELVLGAELSEVLRSLELTSGAGQPLGMVSGVRWQNRTTTMTAVLSGVAGRPTRVVISDPRVGG